MRQSKHIVFENILSKEECENLESKYLDHIKNGWKGYEYDFKTKGISISDPYKALAIDQTLIIDRLTDSINSIFPEKTKYSHSFLRMYKNESELMMHTDREGLDITLTVNIGGLENWPIHVSNVYADKGVDVYYSKDENAGSKYREDYSSFLTPKGWGVACYAKNFPHWRDKLVCKDDEYVLQIFYHWTIID